MFCRCRPDDSEEHVVSFLDEGTLSCPTLQGKEKRFEFDKVFNPSATQEEVSYSALQGKKCTLCALKLMCLFCIA